MPHFVKKTIVLLFVITLSLGVIGCDALNQRAENEIIISGKRFTEQLILAHILGEYLKEKTSFDITVRSNLGGVYILTEALKQKDIDMYVEYTGTGYLNVLKEDYQSGMTKEEVYAKTKKGYEERFGVTWLKPLGFNNTYAVAMTKEHAKKLGIETISELAPISSNLTFCSDAEFYERKDGYRQLSSHYNLQFKKKMSMNTDLVYQAVHNGKVDVSISYSTDPRIAQLGLKSLKDDRNLFPPYYAVPIIRQEILEKHPSLKDTVNQLAGSLTDDKIRYLNGQVNIHHKKAKDVARAFLKEEGLI